MPKIADYETPPDAVAHRGTVVTPPAGPGLPFTVQVPDFDDLHVAEIRRYVSRGAAVPAAGDEVLVVVDDRLEPWVPAWWPANPDDDAGLSAVKGVVVHGSDPNVARPGGSPSVEWIGTVEPLNALDNDTWVNPA